MKRTVSQIVDDGQTHSLFAGLALATSKPLEDTPEWAVSGRSEDGTRFTKGLLHFTPLKTIKVRRFGFERIDSAESG